MASKQQINVGLNFTADTSSAKAQIQQLQQSLSNLSSSLAIGKGQLGIEQDIGKAIVKVQELKTHLTQATNIKTGNLDFSKFSQSLTKSNTTLKAYAQQLLRLGPQGQQAFFQLSNAIATSEIPLRRSSALLTSFATTLKNTVRWQISSSMFHGVISGISRAYNYAQDLNKSLTNIRIVTGQTTEQMAKFADQANRAAQALGTTTTKYTDAALIFYQQGIRDESEITKRTDATIKMANVTGQSAQEVSSQLTAIWNNFSDGSKSLEYYADVITALGAATASSSAEIAQGLSKFAAVADTVGLSYEKATAALATVVAETRQSADIVGTAFKTIFARIEGLKLGETLEDGLNLNQYSAALAKVGVNILDQNGQLKDMDTILDAIGEKWQKLDKGQQVALAQTVAGIRQYSQFIALMNNYGKINQNVGIALDSRGTLEKQQEEYAKGWEAASQRSKAALEELYKSLLNDEFFIKLTNIFTGITKEISNIVKSLGGMGGILSTVGALLTNTFSKQLEDRLSTIGYNLRMMTESGRQGAVDKKVAEMQKLGELSGQIFTGNVMMYNNSEYSGLEGDENNQVSASSIVKKNYEDQVNLQIELQKNSKNMSEQEIKNAQELLQIRSQITQNIIKTAQLIQQKEEQTYNAKNDIFAEISRNTGINRSDATSAFTDNLNKLESLYRLDEQFKNGSLSAEELKNSLGDLGISIFKLNSEEEITKTLMDEIGTEENFLTENLQVSTGVVTKFSNGVREMTKAQLEGARLQETAGKANQAFTEKLKEAEIAQKSLSAAIVGGAQAAMSALAIINNIKGTIDTLTNPDATGWEKFSAVIRGVAMTIMMLSSVMTGINKIKDNATKITAKNTLVETLNALAKKNTEKAEKRKAAATKQAAIETQNQTKDNMANAASEGAKTAAKNAGEGEPTTLGGALKGYIGSLGKLLGPLALIAAAIAVIVGTIVLVKNHLEEAEKAAERTAKSADLVREEYEKTRDAAESFKNTISSYKEAVDGMENLKKGTKEYREQLLKANDQAMKLLETYKDLKYTTKDGLIIIDEDSLQKAEEQQLKDVEAAQMRSLQAQQIAREAQTNADATQFARKKLNGQDTAFKGAAGNGIGGAAAGGIGGAGIGIGGAALALGGFAALASNPVGWAIGIAIGVIGAITGGTIGASINTKTSGEEEALNKLTDEYRRNGNAIFASNSSLRNTLEKLGITDEGLINSLVQNREATLELVKAMADNEDSKDSYYEKLVEQQYGDQLREQANGDEETYKALVQSTAERLEAVAKEKGEKWEDKGKFKKGITDRDAQKAYAEAMGYTRSKNLSNNMGKYYDPNTKQWVEIADEVARAYLAEQEALKEFSSSVPSGAKELKEILVSDLPEGLKAGVASFAGDRIGNFGEITEDELEKAKLNNKSSENNILEAFFGTYDRETIAEKLGVAKENVDKFIEGFINNFQESAKAVQDSSITKGLFTPIKQAYEDLAKTINTNNLTAGEKNNFVTLFENAYAQAGQEGLDLATNFVSSLEGQLDSKQMAEVVSSMLDIDWSQWNAPRQLQEKWNELDFDFDSSGLDGFAKKMQEVNNAANNIDFSNIINQFANLDDALGNYKYGDYLSAEEVNKMDKDSALYKVITGQKGGWKQEGTGDDAGYRFFGSPEGLRNATYQEGQGETGQALNMSIDHLKQIGEDQEKLDQLYKTVSYITDDTITSFEQVKSWVYDSKKGVQVYRALVNWFKEQYGIDITNGNYNELGHEGFDNMYLYNNLSWTSRNDNNTRTVKETERDPHEDYLVNGSGRSSAFKSVTITELRTIDQKTQMPVFSYEYDDNDETLEELRKDYTIKGPGGKDIGVWKKGTNDASGQRYYYVVPSIHALQNGYFTASDAQRYAYGVVELHSNDEYWAYRDQLAALNDNFEFQLDPFDNRFSEAESSSSSAELKTQINEGQSALAYSAENISQLENFRDQGKITDYHYGNALQTIAFKELKWAGITDFENYQQDQQYLIKQMGLSETEATKLAVANQKVEKGYENLTSNLENYKNELIGTNKNTLKYRQNLQDLTKDLSLLFNTDISEEFAESIINDKEQLGLLEKAIKGDEKAYRELASTIALKQVFGIDVKLNDGVGDDTVENQLFDILNTLSDTTIPIGATLDQSSYDTLNELLRAGKITAQQLEAALSSVAWAPDIEYEEVPFTETQKDRIIANGGYFNGEEFVPIKSETELSYDSHTMIRLPILGKNTRKIAPPPLGSNANKNKNSGGGGSRSRKEPKKSEDEIERYHKIDKTIESLTKQYDRLSAAKDAAFGPQKLKYIEQENKLLEKQYEAEKSRLAEVESYYAKDRGAIEAYGAIIDKNGVITNYDQIMQEQLDILNNAYTQYNAGGLSDEIIEAKEKDYEEFKKILSQFEETNNEYLDQLKKLEDNIREQITHKLEGIKAQVEVELELPDQALKMIEFKLKTLENTAFSSAEKIALWGNQAEIAAKKFGIYADAFKDVLTMSVNDKIGERLGGFGFTEEEATRLMSGDLSVLDNKELTGENAQSIIDALKEYQDNLISTYDDLAAARKNIEDELFNQMNEYTEKIDQQINKMSKLGAIAENIKTLIGTIGKRTLGVTADTMQSINDVILSSTVGQISVLRKEQDALEASLSEAQNSLAGAITRGDTEAIQYWEKVNKEIEEKLLDTKENLLSMVNDYAQKAMDILQEKIKDSFDEMARQLYGMTLDDAQASYDRYKTLSDEYLKDYQKIYELSKLTRSVENSINDTDNIHAKERLRDLQQEINEYQAEGVKMTQYEVDYLNKKYELRMAEIALEEAQNAKDQVRLSRNADGGWGYVYTANAENVDKTQQDYEDKLYAMQQLNYEAIENSQSTILQLQKEFQDAIAEIIADTGLSESERNAKIEELRSYYTSRLQVYYDTLDKALKNNKDLYENDWQAYNTLTGYRISADENYLDKFGETWLGENSIMSGIKDVQDAFVVYQTLLGDYNTSDSVLGNTYKALSDYGTQIQTILETAGLNMGSFALIVETDMGKAKTEIDNAKTAGENLATELGTKLPQTITAIDTWQKKFNPIIEAVEGKIKNVISALEGLMAKIMQLDGKTATIGVKMELPNAQTIAKALHDVLAKSGGGGSDSAIQSFLDLLKDWLGIGTSTHAGGGGTAWQTGQQNNREMVQMASGGYTGEWGPDGRIAMLHEKELVLNKQDTANMLQMVEAVRNILDPSALNLPKIIAQNLANVNLGGGNAPTAQQIAIEAHFPNVTNHFEIEEAFRNLANYSSQNAYNFDLTQKVNFF